MERAPSPVTAQSRSRPGELEPRREDSRPARRGGRLVRHGGPCDSPVARDHRKPGAWRNCMAFDRNWLLVVVGAAMIILELSLGGFAGFDLVLVGSTFVLGGIVGLFTGSSVWGYVTALVLGLGYMVVGRRYVRARMKLPRTVHSNVDALIGRQGLVQK